MKNTTKNEAPKREYSHKALQQIEDTRLQFYTEYKFHNTIKTFVTLICFLVILLVLIFKNQITAATFNGFVLIIAILALAVAYGYALFVRKTFDGRMKSYFSTYFECMNEYALGNKLISKIELQKPGKITLNEFNECLLYKDVCEVGSRGLTTFNYKKLNVSIVDCAGNIKDAKRMRPVFVGKMIRAKAKYKGENPIIIYIKGNEKSLPPTNIEGIKVQEEDKKLIIYSNYKDYNKILTAPVKKSISAIKTNNILVDVAISIHKGKLFVMLGYDDPLMVLPLQTEFNPEPSEKYKHDIDVLMTLVEALSK